MEGEYYDRWALVKQMIAGWWPPLTDGDQVPETELREAELRLGHPLPNALRVWYGSVGRREDLMGSCYLLSPDEVFVQDKMLSFCVDREGDATWGIRIRDVALVDPPVWVTECGEGYFTDWSIESESVSEFMWGTVVQATLGAANFHAWRADTETLRAAVNQHYQLIGQPTQRSGHLYGDQEILISFRQRSCEIGVATRAALERFFALTGLDRQDFYHQGRTWRHPYEPNCPDAPPATFTDSDWDVEF